MFQRPQHYESFRKNKSVCEKLYDYCHGEQQQLETPPPTPPRLRRTRRIYKRKERSSPQGEILITVYKEKEHHE